MSFSPRRTMAAALTALALTASALTGLQAPAAAADTFTPVAGPVFGDPTAASNQILSRLLNNIKHTPRNGTIRIVGYSFSLGQGRRRAAGGQEARGPPADRPGRALAGLVARRSGSTPRSGPTRPAVTTSC